MEAPMVGPENLTVTYRIPANILILLTHAVSLNFYVKNYIGGNS